MRKLFAKLPEGYWKKGGGEMLSFALIIPCILTLVCAIIAAAQISYTNQALNYCAYNACRAAVVSEAETVAQNRAQTAYNNQMGTENAHEHGYESCTLEVLGGANWGKGSFVKCTVRYYIETLMPFTSGIREQSIVMMIENGDNP